MAPWRMNISTAFEPFALAGLTLRNRFIKTATFEGLTPGGRPGPELARFHRDVAAGGAALTTVAYCGVSADARTFADQMHVHEGQLEALRALADGVHAEGGAVSGQLAHCGGFSRAKPVLQRRPLGPSAGINAYGLPVGVPLCGAMRQADIERTVADYARTARLLRRAGFDALEIHMGHGYLLSQFISPATNRRSDAYGGSLENRMRFPLQVLAAVREAVGSDTPLLAKINLEDGFDGGLDTADAVQVARLLEAGGIAAIVMSGGFVSRTPMYLFRGDSPLQAMIAAEPSAAMRWAMRLGGKHSFPALPFEPLYFLEQARRVRAAVRVPLAYLGGVTCGEDVERLMREGFELVCVGRALLHDPSFVLRLRDDGSHRSACTHCNLCVASMATPRGTHCVLPGRS
jgi:2,4-dienoyl-CoA reductase-like NADH-dependent reductase (Old Yellow Enzyme family)